MYNVQNSVDKIDEIIANLGSDSLDVRRKAAIEAQYAMLGHPTAAKTSKLLEALANRLKLSVNGHAVADEPDEYVRESCANAFELACSSGKNISMYIGVLEMSREKDPHQWVRNMAKDALNYYSDRLRPSLPIPRHLKAASNFGHEARRVKDKGLALTI